MKMNQKKYIQTSVNGIMKTMRARSNAQMDQKGSTTNPL